MNHYLCILDDFGDFPTKSLLFVFNFWEAENLLFHILMFQRPYGTQKGGDFSGVNIFCMRSSWSTWITQGGPWGPNEAWWRGPPPDRATRARSLVERRLGSVFLCMTPSQKKTYAIFYLEFSEATAEVKPFFHLWRGQILLSRCHHRWETTAIVVTNSSLA